MGDSAGQLTDRLHLLCMLQLGLDRFTVGDIERGSGDDPVAGSEIGDWFAMHLDGAK